MDESTENTNELDSYGVWVKNTPEDTSTDIDLSDALDLPDFGEDSFADTDFSDMFKDDSVLADNQTETLVSDVFNPENSVTPEEVGFEETSIDDVTFDTANTEETDILSFDDAETTLTEDELLNITSDMPETETTEAVTDELDFGAFESPEVPVTEEVTENIIEEPSEMSIPETNVTEEVSFDAFDDSTSEVSLDDFTGGDEEISLDDFMDGGFSDESVASGNNGFAPDAMPVSSDSEEISLDDFLDGDSFDMESAPKKEEETIVDEKPLDMNINFDSSADSFETEDNVAVENFDFDDEDDYEEQTSEPVIEEVAVDAFSTSNSDVSFDTEEVNLEDFGIDSNAEETPVSQDVEGSKNKETVVDYDLAVDNDHMAAAPVVNEIKSDATDKVEDIEEAQEVTEAVEVVEPLNNSLLEQIVADLSSLRNEINVLKNNLAEIKTRETTPEPEVNEDISINEVDIPAETEDNGGFFGSDDGDDTIALSTDELSNILNTADFNTEEAVETPMEETTTESDSSETVETANILTNDFDNPADQISDDTFTGEEPTLDFNDEQLEEPVIDEISVESIEDDLPEEISIPKEDEIFVQSSSSDFIEDSVQESVDDSDNTIAAAAIAGAVVAGGAAIAAAALSDNDDLPETIDTETEEPAFEEEVIEETEEPVFEETSVEEPFIEETPEEIVEETEETSDDTVTEQDFFAFANTDDPIAEESTEDATIVEDANTEPSDDFSFDTFETIEDETVIEDTEDDIVSNEPAIEESAFDSFDAFETEEETITETPVIEETVIENTVSEEPVISETTFEEVSSQEPVFEDTTSDQTITESTSDDDFFGSVDDDFASVENTETDEIIMDDSASEEPLIEDDMFATVDSDIEEPVTDNVEETSDQVESEEDESNFNTAAAVGGAVLGAAAIGAAAYALSDKDEAEETVVEETTDETIAFDDTIVEEPFEPSIDNIEETAVNEDEINDINNDFLSTEDSNNELSDSSFDYLTSEKVEEPEEDSNTELKKDIKSVLLYMDQLLENLPEDKIVEFAKSEEFTTYKKLFSELGLS